MPGSYELHLFRPKPGTTTSSPAPGPARPDELTALDQEAIGDFLLAMGPAVRFGAQTELGEQYLYEDEQGCVMEIMVAEKQVSLGAPTWHRGVQADRLQRVADAIALALVARFDLTLYDPQRGRFVRASRTVD